MKILIVNKFLYPNGGSETYIFELGKQLQKMGHEVQYFGMEHEGRIVGNRAESYTSDMDFHGGGLSKLLYPFKIIYSREARLKIRAVLEDFAPDVVHLNNFNFQLTPSILYEIGAFRKKAKQEMKVVYTAHDSQLVCPNHLMQQFLTGERCTECIGGSPWNCAKNKCIHGSRVKSLLGSIEAWIYRKVCAYNYIDAVICPSLFLKEKLDTLNKLKGKTVVMHNFINVTDVESERNAECVIDMKNGPAGEANERTPYVAYVGRFSKEKGIATLLQVCKESPEIPYVFAGNGPLQAEVDAADNVENKGFLRGKDLREVMQNARFVVFPSECNENCPFTVMEAVSYGTPVIGANIGGVPELIRDGENGLLFESGNKEQLLETIQKIWADETYLKKLSEGCKNTKFDSVEEYCQKMIEKIYCS